MDTALRTRVQGGRPKRAPSVGKWSLRSLDDDKLMAALIARIWPSDWLGEDPLEGADWLTGTLTDACNVAMSKARPRHKRVAYW